MNVTGESFPKGSVLKRDSDRNAEGGAYHIRLKGNVKNRKGRAMQRKRTNGAITQDSKQTLKSDLRQCNGGTAPKQG